MHIPRYWARATVKGRYEHAPDEGWAAWGWSDVSQQDAERDARERAQRIDDAFADETEGPDRYEYGEHPIREEQIRAIGNAESPAAVITRNRYGALVLNSPDVMFADVDFPSPPSPTFKNFFSRLFGKGSRPATDPVTTTLNRLELWARQHPRHAFRLYRTCEGMRLLFTDRRYDPADAETIDVLRSLDADPLYIRLTERQACFRARLTAKPWRIGYGVPTSPWPRTSAADQHDFDNWLAEYDELDKRHRVCELVTSFGHEPTDPVIRQVVDHHDRACRVGSSGLALA